MAAFPKSDPLLRRSRVQQGQELHSIYHRPNGWDYVPPGSKFPRGESSLCGDCHARELALMILRLAAEKPYYTFFAIEN